MIKFSSLQFSKHCVLNSTVVCTIIKFFLFKSPEGRNRNEGRKKEIGRGERKEEGKKKGRKRCKERVQRVTER